MPLLLLVVLLPVVLLALMPLILIQRFRLGAARRRARPGMANLHPMLMTFSAISFLVSAAVTAVWAPNAFAGAAAGLAAGVCLGVTGLLLTRWEATPATLHYTPNRWQIGRASCRERV